MIQLKDLSKSYAKGSVKAVDQLNLTINEGEIFGFLGPNGAGKTTTIKMLCGILSPDSGSILVDGIDLKTDPIAAKKRMAYVPDTPDLFVRLKAMEYLNFVADVYSIDTKTRSERIERFSSALQIDRVLDAKIASFSHGMKQKLLATAALMTDPSNWILDEPLTGLDPSAAFQLKELMRQRASEGKTVFFSTHIMEVAEKLCHRIAIIRTGRIIFTGTVEELRAQAGNDHSLEQLFLELVEQPEEAAADLADSGPAAATAAGGFKPATAAAKPTPGVKS